MLSGGSVSRKGDGFIIPYIDTTVKEKWCPRCRRWLGFKMFNRNRTKPGGYGTECKLCAKQYHKEWKGEV